jgi:aspartate/methionine/tyrosine aminotransferase
MGMKGINPADRIANVSEYYFSRKLKEVATMNQQGLDIINLGIGSPDLPPPHTVIDTLCDDAQRDDAHGYQPYTGIPELRHAFAEWYSRWYGVPLDPNTEILPLIGSKEGIMHISLAFLNAGDEVLVPNPGYPTYTSASLLAGAKVIPYSLKEENGWQPDFQALEATNLERVKLMWTNYPNMPTGAPATETLFTQLVAFGKRHSIIICHDNPYSFILNSQPRSILEVDGAKDVCIEMNSLSKSHNMPGWRIAMLATNPQFAEWVLKVKSNVDSGQYRPMMLAASRALAATPLWYTTINDIYRYRRAIAEDIMTNLGCRFDPSQTGLFLWGRIPDQYSSCEELTDRALRDARVFITPGHIFGTNGSRYIRISLCCKEERLKEARERLTRTLARQ